MSMSLTDQVRDILRNAAGLPEPRYDSTMEAANWPSEFRQRLRGCIKAISGESDADELARAAREIEQLAAGVPEAVGTILARALYDNENTPVNLS